MDKTSWTYKSYSKANLFRLDIASWSVRAIGQRASEPIFKGIPCISTELDEYAVCPRCHVQIYIYILETQNVSVLRNRIYGALHNICLRLIKIIRKKSALNT